MSQKERIIQILKENPGQWVCGQIFNDPPVRISQYHTRIHELEKQGYIIEHSDFSNEYGFKSYKLISEPKTSKDWWLQPEYQKPLEVDKNQLSLSLTK